MVIMTARVLDLVPPAPGSSSRKQSRSVFGSIPPPMAAAMTLWLVPWAILSTSFRSAHDLDVSLRRTAGILVSPRAAAPIIRAPTGRSLRTSGLSDDLERRYVNQAPSLS